MSHGVPRRCTEGSGGQGGHCSTELAGIPITYQTVQSSVPVQTVRKYHAVGGPRSVYGGSTAVGRGWQRCTEGLAKRGQTVYGGTVSNGVRQVSSLSVYGRCTVGVQLRSIGAGSGCLLINTPWIRRLVSGCLCPATCHSPSLSRLGIMTCHAGQRALRHSLSWARGQCLAPYRPRRCVTVPVRWHLHFAPFTVGPVTHRGPRIDVQQVCTASPPAWPYLRLTSSVRPRLRLGLTLDYVSGPASPPARPYLRLRLVSD